MTLTTHQPEQDQIEDDPSGFLSLAVRQRQIVDAETLTTNNGDQQDVPKILTESGPNLPVEVNTSHYCHICGYRPMYAPGSILFRGNMVLHMREEHAIKPSRLSRCPFPNCTAIFKSSDDLQQHQIKRKHFLQTTEPDLNGIASELYRDTIEYDRKGPHRASTSELYHDVSFGSTAERADDTAKMMRGSITDSYFLGNLPRSIWGVPSELHRLRECNSFLVTQPYRYFPPDHDIPTRMKSPSVAYTSHTSTTHLTPEALGILAGITWFPSTIPSPDSVPENGLLATESVSQENTDKNSARSSIDSGLLSISECSEENNVLLQTEDLSPAQHRLLFMLLRDYSAYKSDTSATVLDSESDFGPKISSTLGPQLHTGDALHLKDRSTPLSTRSTSNLSTSSGANKRKETDRGPNPDISECSGPLPCRKKTKVCMKSTNPVLACPFWKLDSEKYFQCCKLAHKRIRDVKQHLHRRHTPEYYCPRCFRIFHDSERHEVHVSSKTPCRRRLGSQLDGISIAQSRALSRKSDRKLDEEQQWFAIWDILFPDQKWPSWAYVDSALSEDLSSFREYWTRRGAEILSNEIDSSDMWSLSPEQRELQGRLLLERGLQAIYDSWASNRHAQNIEVSNRSSPDAPDEPEMQPEDRNPQGPQPSSTIDGSLDLECGNPQSG
ncbi:hypothetical protein F5Y16DRAFT_425183 [Xylariaceae sp. FL0255]|nr:hypothetical protein F5Y16DRAFT_425183 [Xylariaceae sp. FL0255]